jgi:putative SbcD/Mre11-related phosphoesterase
MDISQIQPITGQPVLFFKNKKILVVADLHIGIDSELKNYGITQTDHTQKMIKHLLSICEKQKPKEIILLGDIKHNIPNTTYHERLDVKNFIEQIKNIGTIRIVPGNHDGFIEKLAPANIKIHSSEGFIIENIGFIHGHRWPSKDIMNCQQIIMAHTHPCVFFKDRLNHKTYELCWIKTNFLQKKLKEKYPNSKDPLVIIIPAFNQLCGGISVNEDKVIGPLSKILDLHKAEIYLLDGTNIGNIEKFKKNQVKLK